jgi:UDP:flavonoid glycosyltransferase YjiC (YdhE family)
MEKPPVIRVLFFSRGRGRGHAVPDLAIVEELAVRAPQVDVTFASYGRGLGVLRAARPDTIDLGLPEQNALFASLLVCAQAIDEFKPDVVVAHEEFAAHPAAALLGVPSIYLSAWFPEPGTPGSEACSYAAAAIIIGPPGLFLPPTGYAGRISYPGPVIRRLRYRAADRTRARQELALPEDATILFATSGNWNEAEAPIAGLLLPAFASLRDRQAMLIWQSNDDTTALRAMTAGLPGVRIVEYVEDMDQMMAASDLVVTKGTHATTLEAAAIGVPSVSLTHFKNVVDNILVRNIASNTELSATRLTGPILGDYLAGILDGAQAMRPAKTDELGAVRAAEALRREISTLIPAATL